MPSEREVSDSPPSTSLSVPSSSQHVHASRQLHEPYKISISDVQRFGQFSKVLVDVDALKPSAVRCEALVQRDGPLGVLLVGDIRRDLPLLLLLHCHLPVRRVHDGGRQ